MEVRLAKSAVSYRRNVISLPPDLIEFADRLGAALGAAVSAAIAAVPAEKRAAEVKAALGYNLGL